MSIILDKGTQLKGTLSEYRIIDVLGQGTFSITYLAGAITNENGKTFSQQVVLKAYFGEEKQQFLKQATAISKVRHDGIAKIIDIFESDNTCYYATEYISGGTFGGYIAAKGNIREEEALKYIREVGETLSFLHGKGIRQINLDPHHVMRRPNGKLVITDFVVGKLADPLADVFSLGALLYYALSAQNPPKALDHVDWELMTNILVGRMVSEPTIAVIKKSMQPHPEDRFQTVNDMLHAIETRERPRNPKTFNDPDQQPDIDGGSPTSFHNHHTPKTGVGKLTYGLIIISVAAAILITLGFILFR